MPSPPIQVFLTTIASQPALRQRQEYVLRVLQVKKVPFTSYDLASDEDAKKLWRRKAPLDKQQLPGILIGGEFPGTFADFEEAVEFGELDTFLRLNEEWEPLEDEKPMLRAVPVGIPGAYSPAQMNPTHVSPLPSPIKTKPREGEVDAGELLGDAGLHGVNVTEDDLLALVEELGLDEKDANDLVKGLGGSSSTSKAEPKKAEQEEKKETTEPPKAEPAEAQKADPAETKEKAGQTETAVAKKGDATQPTEKTDAAQTAVGSEAETQDA